ncbi:MAG: helix-turn-helix transcriptional regulator [Planctomycetia bacterium]
MAHLRQLIALDRLLRTERCTRAQLAQRIAERTGVPASERSISRYVEELGEYFGLVAEYDRVSGGYRYTDPKKRLPVGLFLSTDAWLMAEWLASVVGADPRAPRALQEALAQLRGGRIEAAKPRVLRTLPRPARLKSAGSVLDAVERWWLAVHDGRVVRFEYPVRGDKGHTAVRTVEPHGIAFVDGWFQLDGWDRDVNAWRTFLPTRMRSFEEQAEHFERREWNPDVEYAGAFRRKRGSEDHVVQVLLSPRVAYMAEEIEQHPSQRVVETRADGSVVVQWRLSYLFEVLNWVLSLGAEAEVLQPPQLLDLVRTSIHDMAQRYGMAVGERPKPSPRRS